MRLLPWAVGLAVVAVAVLARKWIAARVADRAGVVVGDRDPEPNPGGRLWVPETLRTPVDLPVRCRSWPSMISR